MRKSKLEQDAETRWRKWGASWAMYTVCLGCGCYDHCRGPRRRKMLCLTCFDLGKRKP